MQNTAPPARKVWHKPVVKVHGDLAALTRAKNPAPPSDSSFGASVVS